MGLAIVECSARAGLSVLGFDAAKAPRIALRESAPVFENGPIDVVGSLDEMADCDFIIEAVSESLSIKHSVLHRVSELSDTAIIISNTSTYTASELAESIGNPQRLIVGHFFNPADVAPLVEVVPGPQTDEVTITKTLEYLRLIGKVPIVLGAETPGFVANRLQAALLRECFALVEQEVCTPSQLDEIVRLSLGPRWAAVGPLQVADLGGLDIFAALTARLYPELDARTTVSPLLRSLAEANEYGAKTGSGIYLKPYSPQYLDDEPRTL
jgi:3-hydroxybutyryl-CoA dehydrogenase